MIDGFNSGQVTIVNFATDLPPLIDDLERVSQLPESDNLSELQQSLLHRQEVLLKVKDYLVFLHAQGDLSSGSTAAPMTDVEAIANAVIQELQIKKTEWVAPISQEVDQLHAQKQMLEREIYRLNQQYETILQQFPQQLLSHFQDLLQTQLSKAVELFEQRLRYISSVTHSIPGLDDAGFAASEAQLVDNKPIANEAIQTVQKRLDESLMNLDSTIRTVFGSLEQDVASYQASLTENIQRLYSLGAGTVSGMPATVQPEVATSQGVQEEVEAEAIAPPELPELQALLDVEPEPTPEPSLEMPAGESLFGETALPYAGEETPPEPEPVVTEISPVITPSMTVPLEEASVQEQYLDFAASVTEEASLTENLFGDRPEPEAPEGDEQPETLPATSFLFGDPITEPEPEEDEIATKGLQAVIANPVSAPVAEQVSPESESTTVKTIQLLTDLLEDGALNSQDDPEPEAKEPEEGSAQTLPIEDLNPDLDAEDAAEEALPVTVLAPEQIDQLAEDLTRFEGMELNHGATVDVTVAENTTLQPLESDVKNLWDDGAE